MNKPATRRSFLRNVGLGSLGAVAAGQFLAAAEREKPDAKILGASGVATADARKQSGNPSLIERSAWESSATASVSSAPPSASRTIPTSPWRRSAT